MRTILGAAALALVARGRRLRAGLLRSERAGAGAGPSRADQRARSRSRAGCGQSGAQARAGSDPAGGDPGLQGAREGEAVEARGLSADAAPSAAPVAAAGNTGNAATDTISSSPAARPAEASAANATVKGPPAGPAAIAVARKFADAFVVYETGGTTATVRKAFKATATPGVTKALLQRPPHQPAGVEVPKAKVLNVVPAPSHDRIYPVSVSLLRVGATSELRLEMEQLKNKQWRVANVLG